MLKIFLVLSGISALLFCVAAFTGWRRRKKSGSAQPRRAYFWGLMFALLFYYGFPVWWWRYGLRKTLELMLACIVAVMTLQAILRAIGAINVDGLGESFAVGLFLAVPIRAVAGLWVTRRDAEWRSAIILSRKARLAAS